jgi:acylphosphatase
MKVCYVTKVSGDVQGVYFRASSQQQAIDFGLSGYAKNLTDGTVEVLVCGDQTNVDKMLIWLEHGPETASVEYMEQKQVKCKEYNFFSID